MLQTISAKQARQNFAQILNQVAYGSKRVMVTKFGQPVVVISSVQDFNPQEFSDQDTRAKDFQVVDRIRQSEKKLSAKTAIQLVNEALSK